MWNLLFLALMSLSIMISVSCSTDVNPPRFQKPSAFVRKVDSGPEQLQRRREQGEANRFCTPAFEYKSDETITIYPCTPLPDCDSTVLDSDPYRQRCPKRL